MQKHLFFTFFLGCAFAQNLFSQFSISGNFGLGFTNQDYQNSFFNSGIAILPKGDLAIEAGFHRRFSVVFEVGYHLKGNAVRNIEFTFSDGTTLAKDIKRREAFHYVETSMLLKVKILDKKLDWFGMAGPSIGYLTNTVSKFIPGLSVDGKAVTTLDFPASQFNRTDVGLNLGLGAAYPIGEKSRIQVAARYQHGLTNLIKNPASTAEVYNRTVFLTAGYAYQF